MFRIADVRHQSSYLVRPHTLTAVLEIPGGYADASNAQQDLSQGPGFPMDAAIYIISLSTNRYSTHNLSFELHTYVIFACIVVLVLVAQVMSTGSVRTHPRDSHLLGCLSISALSTVMMLTLYQRVTLNFYFPARF